MPFSTIYLDARKEKSKQHSIKFYFIGNTVKENNISTLA